MTPRSPVPLPERAQGRAQEQVLGAFPPSDLPGSKVPAPPKLPVKVKAPTAASAVQGDRPWCTECGSDEFLFAESATPSAVAPDTLLDVSYTCSNCDGFYAHTVLRLKSSWMIP